MALKGKLNFLKAQSKPTLQEHIPGWIVQVPYHQQSLFFVRIIPGVDNCLQGLWRLHPSFMDIALLGLGNELGEACSLPWAFGWGEVPEGHILAHTGKRPRHSPSSALLSSPRYWVQLVQDNCSGPQLDKTETGREERKVDKTGRLGDRG